MTLADESSRPYAETSENVVGHNPITTRATANSQALHPQRAWYRRVSVVSGSDTSKTRRHRRQPEASERTLHGGLLGYVHAPRSGPREGERLGEAYCGQSLTISNTCLFQLAPWTTRPPRHTVQTSCRNLVTRRLWTRRLDRTTFQTAWLLPELASM